MLEGTLWTLTCHDMSKKKRIHRSQSTKPQGVFATIHHNSGAAQCNVHSSVQSYIVKLVQACAWISASLVR